MENFIYLQQTTPIAEKCSQLGDVCYMSNAKIEAEVYIDQLNRVLGKTPAGTCFKLCRCPHDFGTYLDIRFYYDDEDQEHVKYMIEVEAGIQYWDDIAKAALRRKNYNLIA